MSHEHFLLSRKSDELVYEFDRSLRPDGQTAYKRRDQDLWIAYRADLGWVGYDEASGGVTLRSWTVLPRDQGNYPPEGEWVSKKGDKSYVYELKYSNNE